ncbi:MAG: hypothetical protein J7515_14485 [Caulobacter sp.]|nr:hypothetical protein [Caulobacter sp.]
MKNRRVAQFAPVLTVVGALVVLGVAGGKIADARTDRAPGPKTFSQDGQAYQWSVAHGVTGSVSLSREVPVPAVSGLKAMIKDSGASARAYVPELVISCSGVHSGGFQARFYAPQGGAAQLRLTAGKSVFRTYRGTQALGGRTFVEGHGDLPEGFFDALAAAPTVSVAYGDRTTTFPGPGPALARHFERYCQSLADRASRDEL